MNDKDLTLVGRAEVVTFVDYNLTDVPVRIDTGAKTSSLWVSSVYEEHNELCVVFFGKSSPFYTGDTVRFAEYTRVAVASSTGEVHQRYKVQILIKLAGRKVRASFTLADRSTQAYPVLIGRNVLRGKFVVDVAQGIIDRDAERQRQKELREAAEKPEIEENV